MKQPLADARIAMLVASGFEQSELEVIKRELEQAGATVDILSPQEVVVRGWRADEWGDAFTVDVPLDEARHELYAALILPGGVLSADALRVLDEAVELVGAFADAGKPIGAVCHGLLVMIDADAVRGRRVTSAHAIRADLENSGASWTDEPVIIDHTLVTGRGGDDVPAFCAAFIETLARKLAVEHRA